VAALLLVGTFVSFLPQRESATGTLAAAAEEVPSKSSNKDQVKAKVFLSVDKLPAGSTCKFAVVLDVKDGWHVNANPPQPDNMIPTTVTVKAKHKTSQLETEYPEGTEFEVEALPEAVLVYEGEVLIRGTIEAPAEAVGKTEELEFQVRYQACNDKNCLPPKTLKLAGKIPIVKPGTPIKQINRKYFDEE
jgi:DsbC/DsbD-like thiol-disulfide interchange protein